MDNENNKQPARALGLTDKMGEPIFQDDVVFDNEDYYRIYFNESVQQVEAQSCSKGYLHDISQEQACRFKRMGTLADCGQLLSCQGQIPVKEAEKVFTV